MGDSFIELWQLLKTVFFITFTIDVQTSTTGQMRVKHTCTFSVIFVLVNRKFVKVTFLVIDPLNLQIETVQTTIMSLK